LKLNIVPARTGLLWVQLGVKTFLRQPLALSGLFFMYMVGVSLLSVIPYIGVVVSLAMVPAATLGFMAATKQVSDGRFPLPTVLLTAFRAGQQRFRSMIALGCFFAASMLALNLLIDLVLPMPALPDKVDLKDLSMNSTYQMRSVAMLLLSTPVSLVFWHSPALVHWHGISPAKSLFFSAVAVLRNFGAMTVYTLGWVGLTIAISFLLVPIVLVSQAMVSLLFPIALILTTMFFASIYFTFRDSFVAEEPLPEDISDE
jgi:hypothetical protein